jgi:hypothetical protein
MAEESPILVEVDEDVLERLLAVAHLEPNPAGVLAPLPGAPGWGRPRTLRFGPRIDNVATACEARTVRSPTPSTATTQSWERCGCFIPQVPTISSR